MLSVEMLLRSHEYLRDGVGVVVGLKRVYGS